MVLQQTTTQKGSTGKSTNLKTEVFNSGLVLSVSCCDYIIQRF